MHSPLTRSLRLLSITLFLPAGVQLAVACASRPAVTAQTASAPSSSASAQGASATPMASGDVDAATGTGKGPDEEAMDETEDPCADFYQFACGGWMKSTPVPADESSWVRSFSVIHEENQKALRDILEREARGDTQGDAYGDKLGSFWASCMDEQAIESEVPVALASLLKAIDQIHDPRSLVAAVGRLQLIGVEAPFEFDTDVDFKDSSRMIAVLTQSGLGLPERDYYFRDDARTKALREEYLAHVARTLALVGQDKVASR